MIRKYKEQIMQVVFLLTACVSIAAVVLICVYLLGSGIPTIFEIGLSNFFGTVWKPSKNLFGILPMIVGSIYVTAGAIIIGVPIGLLCAIYLSRFCPKAIYRILKPAVELMAGIPSIVYGFFGLMVIVPVIQRLTGTSGKSLLTASILLGIMILPTIISPWRNPPSMRCPTAIMRAPWHWAPPTSAACFPRYFLRQSPASCPA